MDAVANGSTATADEPKIVRIRTIRSGDNLFQSNGYVRIKATKDNEVVMYEFEIRSTSLTDIHNRLDTAAPKAPIKYEVFEPDSPLGRQLKLARKQSVGYYDLTDEDYLKKEAAYKRDLLLESIHQCLVVDLLDENDQPVTDREKKLEHLRRMGLTMNQFAAINTAVSELTEITERDREHFFGKRSGSMEPVGTAS